ncbi:MAG: ABC transporter permease [Chloroflexi bacterium]|nr:ABC transporter permease [Chloroflexota bacterium]
MTESVAAPLFDSSMLSLRSRLAGVRLAQPRLLRPAAFLLALLLVAPRLAPYAPNAVDLAGQLQGPSWHHWLGTDDVGRDVLSRILTGGQAVLSLAMPAVLASSLLGVSFGVVAGYVGGWLDAVLGGLLNAFLALPNLVVSLALLAAVGPGRLGLVTALAVAGWPTFARLARIQALALRHRTFVVAAECSGSSPGRILARHMLPNMLDSLVVLGALHLGSTLLGVATLSFLGLGDQPPSANWGTMLSASQPFFRSHPLLMVFPGISLALTILATHALADALQDALRPN